jgi:hypothetical protein
MAEQLANVPAFARASALRPAESPLIYALR